MPVSTSLVNSVGILTAFNQTAENSVSNSISSLSPVTTSTTAGNLSNGLDYSISQKEKEIDFFLDSIIILDGKKIYIDNAIRRMDNSILDDTETVNNKLRDLQTAYQNRINAGVTTDLFWRVTQDSTSYSGFLFYSTRTVTLTCVKSSPNGYPAISVSGATSHDENQSYYNRYYGIPLPPIDDGRTLQYVTPSGIGRISISAVPPLGLQYDNLYGIKYYDQPYAVDILDTYVASFPGSIGAGSTVLTIRQIVDSGVTQKIKVHQNIICNKTSVFADGNEIVGIGTSIINIDPATQKTPATATASISGVGTVNAITVSNPGLGYSSALPPTVTIQPASGTVAIGTAVVSAAGTISSIQLSNPGVGYTVAPIITIAAPYRSAASGYGLTGTSGIITSVVISNGGFLYSSPPTVTFSNPPSIGVGIGTTATGTANITAGIVTSVTITNVGFGYITSPTVSFSSPGFTTATASASVSLGSITSISITNPGVGYSRSYIPSVSFSSPSFIGASATATVSIAGTISSINITNPGTGYTFTPSVSIQLPYNDLVPVLYLKTPAIDSASYPESNGSFVTFTVLTDSADITSIASTTIAIPFGSNPYSAENIGIMKRNQVGIGVSLKYDNSGEVDSVQTWRPELACDEFVVGGSVVYPAIREPVVGSGKIYYNEGFTYKPRYPTNGSWRDAVEGDVLTLTLTLTDPSELQNYVTSCLSDTGGYGTAITSAQNIVNTAKSDIQAGISTLNKKISVSTIFRKQRNELNIQIWGKRQLIGHMLNEISEYQNTQTYLNDPLIVGIIT